MECKTTFMLQSCSNLYFYINNDQRTCKVFLFFYMFSLTAPNQTCSLLQQETVFIGNSSDKPAVHAKRQVNGPTSWWKRWSSGQPNKSINQFKISFLKNCVISLVLCTSLCTFMFACISVKIWISDFRKLHRHRPLQGRNDKTSLWWKTAQTQVSIFEFRHFREH